MGALILGGGAALFVVLGVDRHEPAAFCLAVLLAIPSVLLANNCYRRRETPTTTNTELVEALSTILDCYHLHVRGGSNAVVAAQVPLNDVERLVADHIKAQSAWQAERALTETELADIDELLRTEDREAKSCRAYYDDPEAWHCDECGRRALAHARRHERVLESLRRARVLVGREGK